MKKAKSLLVWGLLFGTTLAASAQSDVLSVEFIDRQPDASLGGKAAVVFRAESDDYVITSSAGEASAAPQRVGSGYEYRMSIDLQGRKSDSRVFTVKKRGTPFEGKSPQKDVVANNVSAYAIAEMKTKIGGNEQVSGNTYIDEVGNNPVMACVEVSVPQELDLTVNVNKEALKATVTEKASAGNKIYEIVFSTRRFDELKASVAGINKQLADLDSQIERAASDAEKQPLFTRQDELTAQKDAAEADLASAPVITISGKDVNTLTIDPSKIMALTPKDKLIYGVVVVEREVMKEYTFDELLSEARERYREYPQHTDFAFYEGTYTTYKNTLGHKDCPDAQRSTIQAELDSIISMRRLVNFYEKFLATANSAPKNSETEYKNLAAGLRAVNRLLKYHPELTPFNAIKSQLRERIRQHPMGQKTIHRQVVSGRVSFADPSMAEPFSSLSVYSSTAQKVKDGRSHKIGSVNSDGTYRVVIPDNVIYIYVSGEKNAHYIGNGTTQLDITIE